jgi:hypothetical protein
VISVGPGPPTGASRTRRNVEDPDIEKERVFSTAARFLKNRIVLSLPHASIDRMAFDIT